MHYVLCYDIENDRLRDRVAKQFAKNGCLRIQKSVFVAPHLLKKDLQRLRNDLNRVFARSPLAATDSILVIPLPNEYSGEITQWGSNNTVKTHLADLPLKIML